MVRIFQFYVTTLLNVTGADKPLHLYILAHSCHSKPPLSSFLSPRDAFRNWDTFQDGVLRSIYRSQAGGQRREDSEWDLVLFLRTAVHSCWCSVSNSWDECRRWLLRCRPRCRIREPERERREKSAVRVRPVDTLNTYTYFIFIFWWWWWNFSSAFPLQVFEPLLEFD